MVVMLGCKTFIFGNRILSLLCIIIYLGQWKNNIFLWTHIILIPLPPTESLFNLLGHNMLPDE